MSPFTKIEHMFEVGNHHQARDARAAGSRVRHGVLTDEGSAATALSVAIPGPDPDR